VKTLPKKKTWIWIGTALLLVLLGSLTYIYIPGRGNLPSLAAPDYWPKDKWITSIPEQQGIDSTQLAKSLQSIKEKQIAIDSLTIIRNGYVVLDAYFSPYDGSFPHDLASVTKSVMTTLIGIAVDQDKLQLDQKVVSFFPDRTIANLDERKKNLTVLDLVGMRNGMASECIEGDEATLDVMRASPNWVQAALDRKMVHEPGTHFCYDSPGIHLLSAILQETTGMTAFEFARQYLFEPLGIHEVIWPTDPQGYTCGWGELHMKPTDAAKLGFLWLHGGAWDGRQIVSNTWVSSSVQAHSRMVGNEYGYGYGWWVTPFDFYALGREGQYIRVIPSLNTVLVVTAGGADFNQLMPFLVKLLLNWGRELPANPLGQAKLTAAVSAVSRGSSVNPSTPLPRVVEEISGHVYNCGSNPVGVTSIRLDFNETGRAGISLQRNGQEVFWPVGLDGKYQLAADGQAQTGYWADAGTFVLEIFDIGQLTRILSFAGNTLQVTIPEIEINLECHIQYP
jgi:CubicO group peptidase (beta-lactamase class C family)